MRLGSLCRLAVPMIAPVLAWALGSAAMAQAGSPRAVQEKRPLAKALTIQGPLAIYGLDYEGGGHTIQLELAKKVLFEEPDFETAFIPASYPEQGPARVILLELSSGGTACPSYYKIVELKDDGSAVRSEKFGNCSPMAKSSSKGGVLSIEVPRIGGAAAQSWRYQNGKLSKVNTAPRTRSK